jgi:hypothetical protein
VLDQTDLITLQEFIRREIAAALAEKPVLLTVKEWCRKQHISNSSWFKLKKEGRTPAVIMIGAHARITPKATDEWYAREEKLAQSKEAKLEYERRVKLSKVAGKAAAASPKHICRSARSGSGRMLRSGRGRGSDDHE